MEWEEYIETYKRLLEACAQGLTKKHCLKKEFLKSAQAIFAGMAPAKQTSEVLPKNRRKRQKDNPCSYPKNKFGFYSTLKNEFGPELSEKDFKKLCQSLIPGFESVKHIKRSDSTVLLYSKITGTDLIVNSYIPLDLSNILLVCYAAFLYSYCDTRAILIGDIIDWAYTGQIPYFTAYKTLGLEKEYESLFKPLSLPSAHWLRKQLTKFNINCVSAFKKYYRFIYNLCLEICQRLSLKSEIAQLAFKLYRKTEQALQGNDTDNTLPVLII